MPIMEAERVVSMEMTRQQRKRTSQRANQWGVIRAARAFYGRQLGPEELTKIRAAQEMWREDAAQRDIERMHRARQRNVEQAAVEGAA